MNKKVFTMFLALVLLVLIAGCKNEKPQAESNDESSEEFVSDSTVYGRCGDGTTMHHLELITDKGDTIGYNTFDSDTETSEMAGGMHVGDRLAVIGVMGDDSIMYYRKCINLTSLFGKWAGLDRTFEIKEGGVVESAANENKPYTEWRILNGHLVLSMDTFDIYILGSDSMYLENKDGIYGYKRLTKEQ